MPQCLMGMKMINLHTAEFKDIPKIKMEKMMQRTIPFYQIYFAAMQNSTQQYKYACMVNVPHEMTDDVMEDHCPDLDQGITALLRQSEVGSVGRTET